MSSQSSFNINSSADEDIGSSLVIGLSHFGMAGVTAADYLVRHLDSSQIGSIQPEELPAIAPFEDGVPRHHSRLFEIGNTDLVVLVSELFIPVGAARAFTKSLFEWSESNAIEEVAVLHGVPFPHGPDEHEVFHVATPDYRERRFTNQSFRPLKGGFLDGVVGEVVTRNLDQSAPATGVFLTPTHPPGPDIDASIRLLDSLEALYGFEVDETELRKVGEEMNEYYEQLADRMSKLSEGEESGSSHDFPEDRMFM